MKWQNKPFSFYCSYKKRKAVEEIWTYSLSKAYRGKNSHRFVYEHVVPRRNKMER